MDDLDSKVDSAIEETRHEYVMIHHRKKSKSKTKTKTKTKDQDEEEEVSGFSSKVRHEIQDQVEGDGVDNLVRHIGQHTGKGLGGRVVQGVARVLFDNGTLSVKCENFERGTEGIHENGEEEQRGSLIKRAGGSLEIEENGRDNQSHDGVGNQLTECDARISL